MDTVSYIAMYKAPVHSKLIWLLVHSFAAFKSKENHEFWTSNNLNSEINNNYFVWYLKTD